MSLFNHLIPNLTRSFIGRDSAGEQTEATVKPVYEINETSEAWSLKVQLPGVARDSLEFNAEDNQITIRGRQAWQRPETWTPLHRESAEAPFHLVLEHDNAVDIERIQAELKDGVLQVTLPKSEAVKPRKIAVN